MAIRDFVMRVVNRVDDDAVTVYAAQASFYVIIAAVPFIMLLLSLAQFVVRLDYEQVTQVINRILPLQLHELADTIVGELFMKFSGSVISITALTAIWPASRGMAAIERGVRRVYCTDKTAGPILAMVRSLLYTAAFMGMLLVSLVALVFGGSILRLLAARLPFIAGVLNFADGIRRIIAFPVLCAFFAFVYRSFAPRGSKYRRQIPGAVLATAGWIIFSYIYSVYIENFSNYSYVYGSLAAIVFMMLWLYGCMIIFLVGAEFNVLLTEGRDLA